MKQIIYPTIEKIIAYNFLILNLIRVKKSDRPKVLNYFKLREIVEKLQNLEGDMYDKAAFLLKGLIQKHPFASGNRRTAFIITKEFLLINKSKFNIRDNPNQAKVMIGIREGFYSNQEIKEWIKNGKIREFKR